MKTFVFQLLLALLLLATEDISAQDTLYLVPPDSPAQLRQVHIQMPAADRDSIINAWGEKYEVDSLQVAFDGQSMPAKRLRIRGQSSTHFRRKSYNLAFEDPQPINFGDTVKTLKKVYLISMSMDHSYFKNKLAFACLKELGLFQLAHCYVEVFINDESEGLYLLMQRPEDYVMDDLDGAYLMRRGYRERIDDYDIADDVKRRAERKFNEIYPEVVEACENLNGLKLYDFLNERVDLHAYMKWLAFNYWVRNGDYTDEIYFYATDWNDTVRLQVLPWDYDDLFAPYPHEGPIKRDSILGDKLLFSSESLLDRAIAADPLLYQKYLDALKEVLTHFSEAQLQRIMQGIYTDLYPYFQQQRILEASKTDKYGPTNLDMLRLDMTNVYKGFLVKRRREVLEGR